jgi:hypothetical protein
MFPPQCEKRKEDIIYKSNRKDINVRELHNDGYSDSSYCANCDCKPEIKIHFIPEVHDDWGGVRLTVSKACWPLVPKFAGSNPAEAVGFFGQKNPQHVFLRRGSEAVSTMSQLCGV